MIKNPLSRFAPVFFASLLAVSAGAQSAYFNALTNLNPVGYWPMHEVATPAAGDIETNYGSLGLLGTGYYPDWATANGNIIQRGAAGAIVNDPDTAVHFTKTVITGSAVSFTNGLFVPHTSPLSTLTPPFSVECWYYPSNMSTGVDIWAQNGEEGLNAGAEGGVTGFICGIRLVWVNSTFVVYGFNNQFSLATQNSNKLAAENIVVPSNMWYHLVVTCDVHTNVALYTNGNLAASGAGSGKYSPDYWTPISIGSGLGGTRSIAGYMDEFAVYTNVITDISTHYTDGTTGANGQYVTDVLADNPVIYFRMDGPSYTAPSVAAWPVLTNFGSVAANGVYSPGTVPGIVPGMSGSNGAPFAGLVVPGVTNVPQLSGVSSFADAGFAAAYNPTGSNAFSISALFRGNPCDGRIQTIIGHSANSWGINISTNGKLQCQLGTNTTSALSSVGVYNDGNWHQVVEVYSPASNPAVAGTNLLYVDGALDNSISTVSSNGINPGTNLDVLIGGDPQLTNTPAGVGRQFAGQVCEAALFTNALTAFQIQQLYGAIGVPPVITQQPVSASVNLGNSFTNSVAATGSILGYQWYKNGVALGGQTNTRLIFNPAGTNDASTNYYVVLTNLYTSVTSSVVSLTVNSAPVISTQTTAAMVFAGHNPTLLVNAAGTGTLFYQWTSNGLPIAGATNSSYTVVNAQTTVTYGGTVSNAVGTNSYSSILLTVLPAPANPYPAAVLADHPVDYWRLNEASGTVGFDYISAYNGIYTNTLLGQSGYTSGFGVQTDPTETSADFGTIGTNNNYMGWVPTNVGFAAPVSANAEFSVEAWIHPSQNDPPGAGLVSLGYGNGGEQFCLNLAAASNVLSFFVRNAAGSLFTAQSGFEPTDGNWHHVVGVCDQANSSLCLYADGQLVASNSVPAGGGLLASTQSLTIGARQEGLGTPFDDQVIGTMNEVALYNYALSSNQVLAHYYSAGIQPANVQVQPASLNTNQNDDATFTATATGTPPLSYYWTDLANGNNLISTNATVTIPSVQASDTYQVVVSNAFGTSSTSVGLNVSSGPVYVANQPSPLDFQVPPGYPISVTAAVGGTAPFNFQWYLNSSTPIPGATNATYSFLSIVGTNTYTLWVTNQYGGIQTASSSAVTVEVGATPAVVGLNGGSGWSENGKSSFTGPNSLQLTDGNLNEIASAFLEAPQFVEGFLATFTYTPSTGSTPIRADGTAFCLQNSTHGITASGTDGGGLGYFGITPSVAFELDIFVNRAGGPGINWETNGLTSGDGGLPNGHTGSVNINSGDPIDVTLFYNYPAGQLVASLFDESTTASFTTNYHVGDIGKLLGTNYAYVGFTGGSGGDGAIQTISNFAYSYGQTPPLFISSGGGNVTIGWPGAIVTTNFVLQQSSAPNGPWTNAVATPSTPTVDNDQYQITVPATDSAQFYRLVLPNP